MTQAEKRSRSALPAGGGDPGDRPEWWLVLVTSGICVAGAVAAVVLMLLL